MDEGNSSHRHLLGFKISMAMRRGNRLTLLLALTLPSTSPIDLDLDPSLPSTSTSTTDTASTSTIEETWHDQKTGL